MMARDRRAMVWGVIAVAAAIAIKAAVTKRSSPRETGSLAAKARLLSEARATVAGLGRLEDSAKVLRGTLVGLAPALLTGRTNADAVADLSTRLALVVERAHSRLETAVPEPDSVRVGQLQRVSLRAGFDADVATLATVLQTLARGPTVLTAEWLQVTATDPFSGPSAPERLRIELRVSGWFAGVSR